MPVSLVSFFREKIKKIPQWVRIGVMVILIFSLYFWDIVQKNQSAEMVNTSQSDMSVVSSIPVPSSYPDPTHGSGSEALKDRIQKQILTILQDHEVGAALMRIEKDRPLYHQDGAVFQNREKKLPKKSDRSYYSEWTVKTPGSVDRGARRIIEGKGGEMYFTDDHYHSFIRIR